jgi:ABC-type nitrate/sulfonate/bicarbonate transport system ATPase subunit
MGKQLVEFDSVTKVFPVRANRGRESLIAVQNVSFKLDEGEIVVLLGPSGCGKSTVLRLAAGLDFPTEGRVLYEGTPVTGPSRERGMVFQQYSSFPWLTVRENVKFGLKYRDDLDPKEWDGVIEHFLSLVGLSEFSGRFVSELSGGMQQRLAIARTLAANPGVLLMDEPFGSLDAQNREFLQLQLLQAQANSGKSVLFVSHDVEEAIFLADRVIVLSARPGTVRRNVTPCLPKPRDLEVKTTPRFMEVKHDLLYEVRKEAERQVSFPTNIRAVGEKFRDEHKFSARRHKRTAG